MHHGRSGEPSKIPQNGRDAFDFGSATQISTVIGLVVRLPKCLPDMHFLRLNARLWNYAAVDNGNSEGLAMMGGDGVMHPVQLAGASCVSLAASPKATGRIRLLCFVGVCRTSRRRRLMAYRVMRGKRNSTSFGFEMPF